MPAQRELCLTELVLLFPERELQCWCDTPMASSASSPSRVSSAPSHVSAVSTKLVAIFRD